MTWANLSKSTRRYITDVWQEFCDAATFRADRYDDAISALTVETYLTGHGMVRDLDETRYRYVRTLRHHGLLKGDVALPSDDLLWEMHPMNLEAET